MVVVLCCIVVCSARLELSLLDPGSGDEDAGDNQQRRFDADQVERTDELRGRTRFISFEWVACVGRCSVVPWLCSLVIIGGRFEEQRSRSKG